MIQWIFPARCVVCNQIVVPKGAMIHINCAKKLEFVKEPICKKCGIPMDSLEQEYCIPCLSMDRGWDLGRSVFYYHGVAGIALRQVKKVGTKEFVHFFAVQMRETQKEYMKRIAPNCLVPIPLHPSKFRRRGFNQAELLARALEKEVHIPVRVLLKKQKNTNK